MSNKKTLVVLGDSLAAGVGVEDNSKTLTQRLVIKYDLSLKEPSFAKAGQTTTEFLELLEENKDVTAQLAQADFVVLSIGGNDLKAIEEEAKQMHLPTVSRLLAHIGDNLRKVCAKVRELCTKENSQIAIFNIYDPMKFGHPGGWNPISLANFANSQLSHYSDTLKGITAEFDGIHMADCFNVMKEYDDKTMKNILQEDLPEMLNDHGHGVLADVAARALGIYHH